MMRIRKMIALAAAALIFLTGPAGCEGMPQDIEKATATGTSKRVEESEASLESEDREPYSFTYYFNYDTWDTTRQWGDDLVSAEMRKMFNIDVVFSKPDGDPDANLNTLIASDDLPDAIMMARDESYIKLIDMGMFLSLEPLIEKHPEFMENLDESTIRLLQINGKLWGVPNWPRKPTSLTGGNWNWFYNKKLYQQVGAPELNTLEEVYHFLKEIKRKNLMAGGKPVIPLQFGHKNDFFGGPYRSYGGFTVGFSSADQYTVLNGKVQFMYKDPMAKEAVLFANRLWREGLVNGDIYAEMEDQVAEKIAEGRIGMYYGNFTGIMHDNKGARNLLRELDPENDYIPIEYPPAAGVAKDKLYGDATGSAGWNITCITTKAKRPERIFELLSFMLTQEGSRLQIYGPKGVLWDDTDENGYPVLKKSESELTEVEKRELGIWNWCIPGHADNVDNMKYTVNDRMPVEKKNWVSTIQQKFVMPYMWCNDEFTSLELSVSSGSREGIDRERIGEYVKKAIPQAIMADTEADCLEALEDIVRFAVKNGVDKIEDAYTTAWKRNVELMGRSYLKK